MAEALDRAVEWLLAHQNPEGWWCAEMETNVTMTAEHVLLLRFLGLPIDAIREDTIRYLLGKQRADGSWSLYYEAPADLSTTIEAYVALKVLGLDPGAQEMERALGVIHRLGGVAQARVFTKIWLALFGQYPWEGVPSMPPELVCLPPWVPLNLYDFACWARGTIAPLLIVLSLKPVRDLGCVVPEIVAPGTEASLRRVPGSGPFWWADRALKLYDRSRLQPGRALARGRLVDWILAHQEADGSWGGIQPPWVYSLIALHLQGLEFGHPAMRRGLQGMERFSLRDERGFRFQACMSPVWDTAWVALALHWVGQPAAGEPLERAVRWLLREQIRGGGDWQVRVKGAAGGGWAFEFDNDLYPDIDDTAVIVVALLEAGRGSDVSAAVARAVQWLVAMQSSNGGWGAFDKDNTRQIVYRLPFADFGALLDPPSEDVAAHVLEALTRIGWSLHNPVVERGLRYLRATQRPDGSWFGRWGVNFIYGTWCVVSALSPMHARGWPVGDMIGAGARWMLSRQNADAGWGETCYSYDDESFAGIGPSTPSQTAWAVMTLQLSGFGAHPSCRAGVRFLSETQSNGTWDEPYHTGTGFPRDFYLNYNLYRHVFPTMALALDVRDSETGRGTSAGAAV
ncbi:MAG TPA: squalene--hopene cyclase [Chloroflexota bacterium]|nr:squalene--hopene cyclase [Chloroflexota bacterium]